MSVLMEITFIFRKLEGYICSSISSRSVPVGRQAGRRKHDLI